MKRLFVGFIAIALAPLCGCSQTTNEAPDATPTSSRTTVNMPSSPGPAGATGATGAPGSGR